MTITKKLLLRVSTYVTLLAMVLSQTAMAATVTYYHNDALGSPVAATDAAGNVLWREAYRPYGERIRKEAAAAGNALWYTAKPHEEEFGLSYFGARWYDPGLGRFTGTDPVGFNGENIFSFNRYMYANNNPYMYVDPDGREPKDYLRALGNSLIDTLNIVPYLGPVGNYVLLNDVPVPQISSIDYVDQADGELGESLVLMGEVAAGGYGLLKLAAKKAIKTVGRWMKPEELARMRDTGRVQQGGGGQTRVLDPPNPNAYRNPPDGDVYVEFDVPANRVLPHSRGTGRIPGPGSPDARVPGRNPADYEMPPARNIRTFD